MLRIWTLGGAGLLTVCASLANASTVAGTVTGPDKAPFAGAFVQAQNTETKMMVSVLSDRQGHFRVPDLAAGEYEIWSHATGFKSGAPVEGQAWRGRLAKDGFRARRGAGAVGRDVALSGRRAAARRARQEGALQ